MKQYRLNAWPELRPQFDRTRYRRMLNDMSHRHVSVRQLADSSGLRRREVRQFIDMLCERGLIGEREAERPESLLKSLRPLHGWLRRGRLHAAVARRATQ